MVAQGVAPPDFEAEGEAVGVKGAVRGNAFGRDDEPGYFARVGMSHRNRSVGSLEADGLAAVVELAVMAEVVV